MSPLRSFSLVVVLALTAGACDRQTPLSPSTIARSSTTPSTSSHAVLNGTYVGRLPIALASVDGHGVFDVAVSLTDVYTDLHGTWAVTDAIGGFVSGTLNDTLTDSTFGSVGLRLSSEDYFLRVEAAVMTPEGDWLSGQAFDCANDFCRPLGSIDLRRREQPAPSRQKTSRQ